MLEGLEGGILCCEVGRLAKKIIGTLEDDLSAAAGGSSAFSISPDLLPAS